MRIDLPPARRFEWKYRVSPELAATVVEALRAHTEPDVHGTEGKYFVRSLYYDTQDLRFYHERKDGVKVRRKLRIRNYADDQCYLEIKRKIHREVQKERVALPLSQIATALNGADPKTVMAGRPEHDLRTLERFRFNMKSLGLLPTVLIEYQRHALVGRQDPRLRITLDSELRCRLQPRPHALFEEDAAQPFEEGCVLELKFPDRAPRWLLDLPAQLRLKRAPFSKYCEGIDRMGGPFEAIAAGARDENHRP